MDIVVEVLTNQNFLGAILSSIVFILLGFILRNRNVINEKGKDVLNVIVMKIAIPCMAFCAFMADFSTESFLSNLLVLLFDFGFYIVFLLIANLIFIRFGKEKRPYYAIFSSIGQLALFAMPLLEAVYGEGSGILIPISMMSIAFRVMVYIYSFIVISGQKITKGTFFSTMKTIFLNPIIIFMLLGMIIWATQNLVFQVDVREQVIVDNTVVDVVNHYGFTRIDKTLPALYKVLQMGNRISNPLAMLLIGVTLGEVKFTTAMKNKVAWLIAVLRTFVFPAVALGFCLLFQLWGWIDFTEFQFVDMVVGNAAPVGAAVVVFAVNYNKEGFVGSDAVFISTVLSLISLPIFFVLLKLCLTLPIFA